MAKEKRKEDKTIQNLKDSIVWPKNGAVDNPCSCCNGPFHEATGHIVLDKKFNTRFRLCGNCYGELLPHLKRSWGGERFYDHAGPLPAEAPVGWRPQDVQNEEKDSNP